MKNNLVEVQLAIDSGALEVAGTNQRLGLRGVLRTLAGADSTFRRANSKSSRASFVSRTRRELPRTSTSRP